MRFLLTPRRLATLTALAFSASAANASIFLVENLTGSLGANSTLGGTPLGSDTPFSLTAIFDASLDLDPTVGQGRYSISSLSVTLAGHGTFTGIPSASLNVFLFDSLAFQPAAGLANETLSMFYLPFFNTVTSPYSADAPTPVEFSAFGGYFPTTFSYQLDLAGVPGGLVITEFGSAIPTASITAVPEPSGYVALAGLALGAFALVRRSRLASAAKN